MRWKLRVHVQPESVFNFAGIRIPIDKTGADLLFKIISQRYESGSTIITTNRVFKKWPEIFNNDSTLTSAVLDRLLHHAETVKIEGRSFRMKDKIDSNWQRERGLVAAAILNRWNTYIITALVALTNESHPTSRETNTLALSYCCPPFYALDFQMNMNSRLQLLEQTYQSL